MRSMRSSDSWWGATGRAEDRAVDLVAELVRAWCTRNRRSAAIRPTSVTALVK